MNQILLSRVTAAALFWLAVLSMQVSAAPGDWIRNIETSSGIFSSARATGTIVTSRDIVVTYGDCVDVTCVFGRKLYAANAGERFDPVALASLNLTSAIGATETIEGRVALVGSCGTIIPCVVRINPDGTPDLTFNAAGPVPGRSSVNLLAQAIASQRDGKLVFASKCVLNSANLLCVARLNVDGSADDEFSSVTAGIDPTTVPRGTRVLALPPTIDAISVSAIVSITPGDDKTDAAVLQPDGKVLLVGTCPDGQVTAVCIARFNENGTLDTRFNRTINGSPGVLLTRLGVFVTIGNNGATLQPDGKLLVAAKCRLIGTSFCLIRYNTDGSLDAEFGLGATPGIAKGMSPITPEGGDSQCGGIGIALSRDGRIFTGDSSASESGHHFFCAGEVDGGSSAARNCSMDIDGDGRVSALNDALIKTRVSLGFSGADILNGISFPDQALRRTWPEIRNYLITQCGMSVR
jgi:uncharacterized delta-60 repeat protein